MIVKKEKRRNQKYQVCCGGDFTPALPDWQVWTKTSVGGVFTTSLLVVRRLAEVTTLQHCPLPICHLDFCFKRARFCTLNFTSNNLALFNFASKQLNLASNSFVQLRSQFTLFNSINSIYIYIYILFRTLLFYFCPFRTY